MVAFLFAGINESTIVYVRNGHVNANALKFIIPLKNEVNDLYFTWHSKSAVSEMVFPKENVYALNGPAISSF